MFDNQFDQYRPKVCPEIVKIINGIDFAKLGCLLILTLENTFLQVKNLRQFLKLQDYETLNQISCVKFTQLVILAQQTYLRKVYKFHKC